MRKVLKKLGAVTLILVWFLAGWSVIYNNSMFLPKIEKVRAAGGDFTIIRGTTVISSGQASARITNGVEYTLESGQDNTTADIKKLRAEITKDIQKKLPVKAIARKVYLMEKKNKIWQLRYSFTFS